MEPGHPGVNYVLGRFLLDQGGEAGIAHVERAMEREPDSVLSGCELV